MNDRELSRRLEQALSDVPASFHNAMLGAFAQIQEEEQASGQTASTNARRPDRRPIRKRTAAVLLIAAMLTATVALAATFITPRIVAFFWGEQAPVGEELSGLLRTNVAEETIGDCRVRVDEALYDGVMLYVTYSIRNMTVERMLGETDPIFEDDIRWLTEADAEEIRSWEAGYWADSVFINGLEYSIPGGTTDTTRGGDEPGEYVTTIRYDLSQLNIELRGTVRFGLPVGRRQNWTYEIYQALPKGENGGALEPAEGCVDFTFDADAPKVERVENGRHVVWADGTEVWVGSAAFTDARLYMTICYRVSDRALADYRERHGDVGRRDENGTLTMPFDAVDAAAEWAYDLWPVDAEGRPVGDPRDTWLTDEGVGAESCLRAYPYADYPTPLYVAPVVNGVADLSRMIPVRE